MLGLSVGDRYDRFEILEIAGVGAFSAVYKVRTPDFAEPLALKISLEPVRTGDVARRALREVAVLRKLTNDHVVRVRAAGLRPDGHVYILMEWVDGQTLDAVVDLDRVNEPARVLPLFVQICEGVAEGHTHGIVHRDLKPANVLVRADQRVKVLDFGFARSWQEGTVVGKNATLGRTLIGTPHYAQPEQLTSPTLTPAADVYSLGFLLYEALSGQVPFVPGQSTSQVVEAWRNDIVAWLRAHAEAPVIALRERPGCEALPQGLCELVEATLHKDPSARPKDAGELARALR